MSSSHPDLSTERFEHAAMDYARLREDGLRLLGRLAGAQWSDFNAHDPGVTILEQLCYAITDLGYRIDHPMADLLAGPELALGLPEPAEILTCDPVTPTDLRKLAIDTEGIENAWVVPRSEPELAFHHHPGSRELRLRATPGAIDTRPVSLRGLDRVLLQTGEAGDGLVGIESVAARLHGARALGTDFEVATVGRFPVVLTGHVEIGAVDDPAGVLAEILDRIELFLSAPVRPVAVVDAIAEGVRVDEVFEGPRLERGVVRESLAGLRRTIYVSDLVHVITEVEGVRAVRSLALGSSAAELQPWALDLPEGPHVASVASDHALQLQRGGLTIAVARADVDAKLNRRRSERAPGPATRAAASLPEPARGRDRKLGHYRSIQHEFPAAYGIGSLGLPRSAPARRHADARQLEGYLLIFDQLLANAFAQLAHARELLSPGSDQDRTYFAQRVVDPNLRLDELVTLPSEAYEAWLLDNAAAVPIRSGKTAADRGAEVLRLDADRRKRFVSHLLARFAEQLGDHVPTRAREALLRECPRLGRARGSGQDVFATERSALERRVDLELGHDGDEPAFFLVEHVLLRPIAEDGQQLGSEDDPPVPLLAGVAGPDPWSLQVSYVFREPSAADDAFEQLVKHTILALTPAHLTARLHWFGDGDEPGDRHWSAFVEAWSLFRAAYRDYRRARLRNPVVEDALQIGVRDARDRVIDLLGLGRTYPIRDLPLPKHITVAPGKSATIPLVLNQRGVIYELRDRRTGVAIEIAGEPVVVVGTGEPLELPTPAIVTDVSYRILAVKLHDGQRHEAWLHGAVTIEEGIDVSVVARIKIAKPHVMVLDSSIDDPQPGDARIVDFGAQVEVEVEASQEGVVYELIDEANHETVLSVEPVVGTGGTIVLRSKAVSEDLDLRVRGSRQLGDDSDPDLSHGILTLILPLRVRASAAVIPTLATAAVLDHGGKAKLRLSKTQASASYRVWRRRVYDSEFVFGPAGEPTIDVEIGDERVVRVLRPSAPLRWQDSAELEPVGTLAAGTGGTVERTIGEQLEDTLLFVQAIKVHRQGPLKLPSDPLRPDIESAVRLSRALVQLVRPDPRPTLRLQVELDGDATTGPILVEGGQPGVFYELLPDELEPIERPAYVHQRDRLEPKLNKGIAQLRLEVDFVVARDPGSTTGLPTNLAARAPQAPLLDGPPLPVATVLRVRARRAMTGLTADVVPTASIAAVPKVSAKPATVAVGEQTKIVLDGSAADQRYRLLRGAVVIAESMGTGAALELATGPIAEPTRFMLAVASTQAIVVERRIPIEVHVEG